jgi:hypothetical protein
MSSVWKPDNSKLWFVGVGVSSRICHHIMEGGNINCFCSCTCLNDQLRLVVEPEMNNVTKQQVTAVAPPSHHGKRRLKMFACFTVYYVTKLVSKSCKSFCGCALCCSC